MDHFRSKNSLNSISWDSILKLPERIVGGKQIVRKSTLSDALDYLVDELKMPVDHLNAGEISPDVRFYAVQSPNYIYLTDGEGVSCCEESQWQFQKASFCICINTKTGRIVNALVDPALLNAG